MMRKHLPILTNPNSHPAKSEPMQIDDYSYDTAATTTEDVHMA